MSTIQRPTAGAPMPGSPTGGTPSPRLPRLAWRVVGTLVTLFLLGMALLQLVGLLAYNVRDVEHTVDATAVRRLEVVVDSGDVEVVGVDADTITLSGTIRSGLVGSTHSERVQGSVYQVQASCPDGPAADHCDTSYRLEVPQGLSVRIRMGDGMLTLRDLRGDVDASTHDSPIRAAALSGSLELRTSNDEIRATALTAERSVFTTSNDRVRAEFATTPMSVRVRTSNDAVDVVVPDSPDPFAVRVRTSNGSQRIEVRTDPSSDRVIDVATSNDDVAVTYPPS